uniref:THAP domain-containing protein 11-like isoform X1 n=1 Tax=Diabrotica virgifera virgifera TaxID=50390 RepID=A0A6P7GX10_DIAVI
MENKSAQYKYCIVPGCKSTTVRTSNKHFFTLPKEPKRRLKWLKACRRDKKDISQKSIGLYVCEDHFDVYGCHQ